MYLLDRIEHWADETPDSPALIFQGEAISFRVFSQRIKSVATKLANEHGVKPGDRVAYLGINHPNMLYLVFACSHLGAIFAPFNTRLAEGEYRFLLQNAEPKLCFFDDSFEQVAEALSDDHCSFVPIDKLDGRAAENTLPVAHQNADDALLLVYTSGTTGRPKGVLLSNEAVAANIENGNALYGFRPGQNVLITLPLFHVGGLCILLLPALTQGATIHLHARFDPSATLSSLMEQSITTTILVPAQMGAIMQMPEWETASMSSMNYVVVGSSIIPMWQIKEWHRKGIPVSQVYGATETGPTAIGLLPKDAKMKEGSAGQPAKLCSIEIRRQDETECAIGENGELWVNGPNILSGYWHNREETNLVLQNGWYNTGDIGHVDEDGFYWIVDRSKDVIISGGENIYPAEIENIALAHPNIEAIAVVGRRDERWGEVPVAAVELKQDTELGEGEFQQFLVSKIARFKQPKTLIVFEKLPRNGMGKIEKAAIRQLVNS